MKASSLCRVGFASRLMQRLATAVTALAAFLYWSPVALADGCDPSDPFLADVIDAICSLTGGGGGGCINQSDTCTQVEPQLFTGVTLNSPSVGNPQWCELGGRGQIMGEAALCLLRDLAQPAQSPSQGGPGITISTPAISLGPFGNVQATQRVGFLSFDVPGRVMKGYHDVSFCLPVFGCVNDATQQFTASLVQGAHGQHCGDYPIDTGHALDILADDDEHSLSTDISPIVIYTPYGPVSVKPQFGFGSALKVVGSPYGDPATVTSVRDFYTYPPTGTCSPRALLFDAPPPVLGTGILLTANGGAPPSGGDPLDGGRGWDSQVALGGRDADPTNPLWAVDATKTRPDLDQSKARKVDEKKFVGNASASLYIPYDPSKLLPAALNSYPFHVELSLSVTPAVATSAASQFNLYMAEGSFRQPVPPLDPDCHGSTDSTRLVLQSRVDSYAAFTITIEFKFFLEIDLGFFSKTLIDIDAPITPVNISDKQWATWPSPGGSAAGATSSSAPPASPSYGSFTSFSSGAVNGAQFVAACLTEPPPPEQPLPQPGYVPGDPNQLVPQLQWPCNVCVAYDTYSMVCVPKVGLPTDYAQYCQVVNNSCVDTSGNDGCENHPLQGGASVLFPAPQPANKQWLCDSSSKLGCYDLCSWDPSAQTPMVVVQSAIDVNPDLNCNAQTQGQPCGNDAQCDDQDPCTDDYCGWSGEFKVCKHTAHDGIPCDDGLFCDGTDTCYLGACSQHSGNPCASGEDPGCCDESAGTCLQSRDSTVCGDGIIQFGEQCDDGNTTSGDGCSANCTVETGFSCIGQPSICTLLPPTPTPPATPTPTYVGVPVPVIPSASAPAGLLLIIVLLWLLFRAAREEVK